MSNMIQAYKLFDVHTHGFELSYNGKRESKFMQAKYETGLWKYINIISFLMTYCSCYDIILCRYEIGLCEYNHHYYFIPYDTLSYL